MATREIRLSLNYDEVDAAVLQFLKRNFPDLDFENIKVISYSDKTDEGRITASVTAIDNKTTAPKED